MTTASSPRLDGWRAPVLAQFQKGGGQLLLVADPDRLLDDEPIQTELAGRGYDLFTYDDPMAFRAMYERDWRTRLERGGDGRSLAVCLRLVPGDVPNAVPFDLLTLGKKVNVSLARLFQRLAPIVLGELDATHLDGLWEAVQQDDAGTRGPESTQDFVLREVFGINLGAITKSSEAPARLLTALLRLHFQGHHLPPLLVERAAALAGGTYSLTGWPLPTLLGDRAGFLAFVQRHWAAWVERLNGPGPLVVAETGAGWGEPDGITLPFDDKEVGVLMDSYFLHGLLVPVPLPADVKLPSTMAWASIGVVQNPQADAERRLGRLLSGLKLPGDAAAWGEWTAYASQLADATALVLAAGMGPTTATAKALVSAYRDGDVVFVEWLAKRIGGLASLPHSAGPVMVHHIPRYMAERRSAGASRVALLVMDGLALDQWAAMRAVMPPVGRRVLVDESAAFAWMPTLTNVSRQAIFAGSPPWAFPKTIYGTGAEDGWWRKFWDGQGVLAGQVRYLGVIDPAAPKELNEAADDPSVRVVGAVIGLVDNLIHEFPLPRRELLPVLTNWAKSGVLSAMISTLLDAGFEVFLTADHGNTDASACGKPDDGKAPDIRGQRVRVFPSEPLRSLTEKDVPGSRPWPTVGLPSDFVALLAPPGTAFIDKGTIVCHGGPSLLEVMVPFVHFKRGES